MNRGTGLRWLVAFWLVLFFAAIWLPMGRAGSVTAQTPDEATPVPASAFPFPLPPAASTATPSPPSAPDSSPSPEPTPVPRPREDSGLKPVTLGGWMKILEVTPTLGDEIAGNGRLWIVFEHQISQIPEGWRLGYRIYGAFQGRDGRQCGDCYLAEGTFGNIRGYISGKATITWTSFPDANVSYQWVQLCVTAIDPQTNEIRLSNLCEMREQGG